VTKLAYLTYSNLPVVVKGNMAFDYVAQQLGITVTSIPISITSLPNITSLVLSVENSGATGLYAAVLPNYTYGILTGLKQGGYHVKVGLSLAGQGQPLLDDPSALAAAQGLYFVTPWDTFSPGFAKMRAALKKYENFPGLPDLNIPYGWLAADLMIQGLQAAGKNPTQASFLAATKAIKNYSADGMLNPAIASVAQSIDAKALGAPGFCQRLLHLQGTQFLAAGLICGKLLKGFGGE
jgi:branched-chain amino acid transport system substrate-binding protein